jgi:hypothetical protein
LFDLLETIPRDSPRSPGANKASLGRRTPANGSNADRYVRICLQHSRIAGPTVVGSMDGAGSRNRVRGHELFASNAQCHLSTPTLT